MIASIEGKLVSIDDENAFVKVGQLTYQVMLPAYCLQQLGGSIGEDIVLCTMQYYEGTPGGGNLIPRMVGFLNSRERDFFFMYTSVKGIGIKKALRSLAIPIDSIAAAVENGDDKILMTLPGVGKRMAQQILAELKGRLGSFALEAAQPAALREIKPFQGEALEILIAWGEKRNEAIELINMACKNHPDIKTAEALVPLVYRLKQGVGV